MATTPSGELLVVPTADSSDHVDALRGEVFAGVNNLYFNTYDSKGNFVAAYSVASYDPTKLETVIRAGSSLTLDGVTETVTRMWGITSSLDGRSFSVVETISTSAVLNNYIVEFKQGLPTLVLNTGALGNPFEATPGYLRITTNDQVVYRHTSPYALLLVKTDGTNYPATGLPYQDVFFKMDGSELAPVFGTTPVLPASQQYLVTADIGSGLYITFGFGGSTSYNRIAAMFELPQLDTHGYPFPLLNSSNVFASGQEPSAFGVISSNSSGIVIAGMQMPAEAAANSDLSNGILISPYATSAQAFDKLVAKGDQLPNAPNQTDETLDTIASLGADGLCSGSFTTNSGGFNGSISNLYGFYVPTVTGVTVDQSNTVHVVGSCFNFPQINDIPGVIGEPANGTGVLIDGTIGIDLVQSQITNTELVFPLPTGIDTTTTHQVRVGLSISGHGVFSLPFIATLAASIDIPVIQFTAVPTTVGGGGTSVLNWTVTGTGVTVTLDGVAVAASGTKTVTPSKTTTYTLTATNAAGSVSSTATVTVTTTPVLSGVFNAYGMSGIAPCMIGYVQGSALTTKTVPQGSAPFGNTLSDGTDLEIKYASGSWWAVPFSLTNQSMIVQAPCGLPLGAAQLILHSTTTGTSKPFSINIMATNPGYLNPGTVTAYGPDGSTITTKNPASPGMTIVVCAVGLGNTTPSVKAGTVTPANPVSTVITSGITLSLNGTDLPIMQASLVPGKIGVYGLEVQIPSDLSMNASEASRRRPVGTSEEQLALILKTPNGSATGILPIGSGRAINR